MLVAVVSLAALIVGIKRCEISLVSAYNCVRILTLGLPILCLVIDINGCFLGKLSGSCEGSFKALKGRVLDSYVLALSSYFNNSLVCAGVYYAAALERERGFLIGEVYLKGSLSLAGSIHQGGVLKIELQSVVDSGGCYTVLTLEAGKIAVLYGDL